MRSGMSVVALGLTLAAAASAADLWELARSKKQVHQFSTLFTAQDVRDRLSGADGIREAQDWCRQTGVTKVYIETFRDGYTADRDALIKARDSFRSAGFEVSGCVTPTQVGKPSTGWKPTISCYTDLPTQDRAQALFEYAASLFDEVMVDDFWFTDCTCDECDLARRSQRVSIGGKLHPVPAGQSWADYRSELMYQLSRERVVAAARKFNKKVKLIVKFPQWYDTLQERGYDVERETALFDRIWAGTETRERSQGGAPPYEAYFVMRWLDGIGGRKTGGGWYDPFLHTAPPTYLEQARQTVLAGARETVLFAYGALHRDTGPADIEALRANVPELLQAAEEVRRRVPVGIAAYKPVNSNAAEENYVFDDVGMLGLPLLPTHQFPEEAPAAFFSLHSLKDPTFLTTFAYYIASGKPVLVTDGLAQHLENKITQQPNVRVLNVGGHPKNLLELTQKDLDPLREHLLRPLKVSFKAPNQVGLYLFKDGAWVVENFTDQEVAVELNGSALKVPARGWVTHWK